MRFPLPTIPEYIPAWKVLRMRKFRISYVSIILHGFRDISMQNRCRFLSLKKNTERVIAMEKVNDSNKLAIQMLIAMVSGILVGLLFMAAREYFGADSTVWNTVNNLLFQDITAPGAERSIGLFYIGGQLFIRALQLIIVPMVFCSVVMAISEISEASTLGRVSAKTIGWFMMPAPSL